VGRGTVRLSKERLFGLAESTGFRPDLLEKAVHLMKDQQRTRERK